MSAKLTNPWGAVAGQSGKFMIGGAELACVAQTNNDGVATCDLPGYPAGAPKLSAEFAGATSATFVDLPASA